MKTILGLDLGTNSIGWALVEQNFENKEGNILGLGSRIIPMDAATIGDFGKGNSVSQTAERTKYRSIRRLRERHLLRRERLHRVLNILGFLPEHYKKEIDFEKKLGKFIDESEPKLAWRKSDNGRFEFLFENSFQEMVKEFNTAHPNLKVPYDWTIYYLRKKAISERIDKEELAWLILNFNQKRGYYQARGEEDDDNPYQKEYVIALKVEEVEKGEVDAKNNKRTWYKIKLSNGWEYNATFTTAPNWENLTKEFLVVEEYDENGNIKIVKDKKSDATGKEKRRITPLPSFEDIELMSKKDQDKIYQKIKARTELSIQESGTTVGEYIYRSFLKNPTQKIRGKLIRTIERKFYKNELLRILEKQKEFHPELRDEQKYFDAVRELYKNNDAHISSLKDKDLTHLFINDIIFYQRPLRSKKSLIGKCPFEYRKYKIDGECKKEYLSAISKSNPYFQEFRIWQWLSNLKIYLKEADTDVTSSFINEDTVAGVFTFLISQKEVDLKSLLRFLLGSEIKGKALSSEIAKYRWNYAYDSNKDESKKYPCNETGYEIRKRLNKIDNIPPGFLTPDIEYNLWHILYSVTDKEEYEKALRKFATKYGLDEKDFVESFWKFPPFKKEYGAFSEKAIKKLLPLMRAGKYWNWENIDVITQDRIQKIITGEVDDQIHIKVREKADHQKLDTETDFQGLPLWLAQYIVYGRHSEAENAIKWNSTTDLENYLKSFRQHSLRNPIVEQVVTETLRVVRDIWMKYGNSRANFFDEIHIELSREMKHTAKERQRLANTMSENENTNQRIRALLIEMMNDAEVENVRPYSPMQQEILKIYENGVLNSGITIDDDILKISKKADPTKSELQRYKLWLEQKYRSPYTGQVIPLNKLFTSEYEIEHIIPQSLYFDDSLSNKVICESAVNSLKDHQLGLEFIKNHFGQKVQTGFGREVEIFTEDQYREFVKEHYSKNPKKRIKLLLEEIPEKMVERQLNDTRHISKFISSLLSNIVRADSTDDGVHSKNLVFGNGRITSELKQDWGLNDVWNDLILPRFERMNAITQSNLFTSYNERHQKHLPTVPFEYSKGFQKKRIDHRHHAMDALVIACATRDHVNLLNNQSSASESKRYDLQNKLRRKEPYFNEKEQRQKYAFKEFYKPWDTFTSDAKLQLEKMVVSFKQNIRIINKATNHYEKWVEKNGVKKKELVVQKGLNWAIRKPLHKDTVSGKVDLPYIKVPKGKILTATRKTVYATFDVKTIKSITDTGIQKILLNYLDSKGSPETAFSPEGLEELNNNIRKYNEGKFHQPIYKVRIFETGSKFPLGEKGNRKFKYVEAAKSTNLFFAIYLNSAGKRIYETIPLNEVIERQKQGLSVVPEINSNGDRLLFYLSPNDLVYIPEEDENPASINFDKLSKEQASRMYKMVSSTGGECYFVHMNIATPIKCYDAKSKIGEFGSMNKEEVSMDNTVRIKEKCFKIKIDRIGNISTIIYDQTHPCLL